MIQLVEDKKNNQRDTMAEYVEEYLLSQFGMKKMAEEKKQTLVNTILTFSGSNSRLFIFGTMIGVVKPEIYSPIFSDIVLQILGRIFSNWGGIAEKFFANDEGSFLVTLEEALFGVVGVKFGSVNDVSKNRGSGFNGILCDLTDVHSLLELIKSIERESITCKRLSANDQNYTRPESCHLLQVDLDKVLNLVFDCYEKQIFLEKERLHKLIVEEFDIDRSGAISIEEFKGCLEHLSPKHRLLQGKNQTRSISKAFHKIWQQTSNPENEEEVLVDGVVLFCVGEGIMTKHGQEKRLSKLDLIEMEIKRLCQQRSQVSNTLEELDAAIEAETNKRSLITDAKNL